MHSANLEYAHGTSTARATFIDGSFRTCLAHYIYHTFDDNKVNCRIVWDQSLQRLVAQITRELVENKGRGYWVHRLGDLPLSGLQTAVDRYGYTELEMVTGVEDDLRKASRLSPRKVRDIHELLRSGQPPHEATGKRG